MFVSCPALMLGKNAASPDIETDSDETDNRIDMTVIAASISCTLTTNSTNKIARWFVESSVERDKAGKCRSAGALYSKN